MIWIFQSWLKQNENTILNFSHELLTDKEIYPKMPKQQPYGDGKASERIADTIIDYFNKLDYRTIYRVI